MSATSISIIGPVIEETAQLLRRSGRRETVVYWAGLDCGARWIVTTAICPRQQTTRGSFVVDAAANAEVIKGLAAHHLVMLGQVHTHPGSIVDHSDGDDEWTSFAFEGFVSIVVPSYCRSGLLPLTECGVHRYESGFRRLTDGEIGQLFNIVPACLNQYAPRISYLC